LGSVVPGVGTALGAAVGSGLNTGIKTGNPLAGLASAGGSYLGSSLGGDVFGDALGGTVGSSIGGAANVLPSFIADASLGSIAGGALGSSMGESLFAGNSAIPDSGSAGPSAAKPFSAKQEDQVGLPGSLSQFGGLSPLQLGTNIATQGVYGGGQGPEESNYFTNMVNRRLVDETGNVDSDFSDIAPIEMSYLDQLGFGGNKTPKDLLQALSGRMAA
jgi:hypothetical protein